ncbi:hypothetical protein FXF51_53265 [Nonomuraea sp. PA05]|uniref:hypothetical protein n=1 Tax=Nonomuraea sp. PA05 TaxID=2604466 RepID=UPI0011D546BE|nr:hypothetical protein [Nonomuraea sp. PA05]TYB51465.1 hypothetical protein FXF51_53265 [Nonomuraea sp. PA05]
MVDWDGFDSHTYVNQNYGRRILQEDLQIMRFVMDELRDLAVIPESLRLAADIGAGPNLYPALLLAPYLHGKGTLEFVEHSAANLAYLRDALERGDGATLAVWAKFERLMRESGHRTSLRRVRDAAVVKAGSIFDLPVSHYDAVMCFFVAESITTDPAVFTTALDSLLRSLKPGGLFVTAHMVGSTGYQASPEAPEYPACSMSMADIEKSYIPYGPFRSTLTRHTPEQALRSGYDGMAALVGRRD